MLKEVGMENKSVALTDNPMSFLIRSHARIRLRPRHRVGRGGLRRHPLLRRGHVHHLRLRLPPQRASRRRLEMGGMQRGRRLRRAGVPGVRGRPREPSGRPLGHEQTQQRGRQDGECSEGPELVVSAGTAQSGSPRCNGTTIMPRHELSRVIFQGTAFPLSKQMAGG